MPTVALESTHGMITTPDAIGLAGAEFEVFLYILYESAPTAVIQLSFISGQSEFEAVTFVGLSGGTDDTLVQLSLILASP